MSMNLHVEAEREVTVNKTGKQSVQKLHFDLWQTPTVVTRAILSTDDPSKAYKEWVASQGINTQTPFTLRMTFFAMGNL